MQTENQQELATTKLRFGVLSTATIAKKVIDAIFNSKSATVVCVGSRTVQMAEKFAKECNIARWYGSYEEVLDDPNVDAVYIPVPSTMKKEWAFKSIEKGKHILVEKPFVSEAEVHEMIEACHRRGLQFMDGTMWVHHARTHAIKKRYLDDHTTLGPIQRVHAVLSRNIMETKDTNIRFQHDLEPKGALGDVGWYCIRGILWAFNWDLPTRVLSTSTFYNKNSVDTTGMLWFSHGRVATFSTSFKNSGRQMIDIQGTKATLHVRDGIFFPFWNEPFEFPENKKINQTQDTEFFIVDENGNEKREHIGPCTQVIEMINDFTDAVMKKKSLATWEEQTVKTQRVLDALMKSCEQHSTISLA